MSALLLVDQTLPTIMIMLEDGVDELPGLHKITGVLGCVCLPYPAPSNSFPDHRSRSFTFAALLVFILSKLALDEIFRLCINAHRLLPSCSGKTAMYFHTLLEKVTGMSASFFFSLCGLKSQG